MRASQVRLALLMATVGSIFVIMVTVTVVLSPRFSAPIQHAFPTLAPQNTTASTTSSTATTSTSTTTTTVAATNASTTTAVPTTAAIVPLGITCPPDALAALGSALTVGETGNGVASPTTQPGCGSPVVFYADYNATYPALNFERYGVIFQDDVNLVVSSAVGAEHVLVITGDNVAHLLLEPSGALVDAAALAGNCSGTNVDAAWDADAQLWVVVDARPWDNTLCIHVGNFSEGNMTWALHTLVVPPPFVAETPLLGVWPGAYAIGVGNGGMCVVDRDTLGGAFCAASISAPLAGFSSAFRQWAPLGAHGPLPPSSVASPGGSPLASALFVRHRDDELHSGAVTPGTDFLDIDHWTSINFTAATYDSLRYSILMSDFDSSFAGCASETGDCGWGQPPLRHALRVSYRTLENVHRVAGAFTSHANGASTARVRWFELRWGEPAPLLAERWLLSQEGTLGGDGLHRWAGGASVDRQGTLLVAYHTNETQLEVTWRLRSDPPNTMRTPESLSTGTLASLARPVRVDAYVERDFYISALDSVVVALRVGTEYISRLFTAQDTCTNLAQCTQNITAS
jgi:hypothetical protein